MIQRKLKVIPKASIDEATESYEQWKFRGHDLKLADA